MAIEQIAVIGAGTMGHGIAQVAAQAGFEVVLEDVSDELVARGVAQIEDNLGKGVERGKLTTEQSSMALNRITTSTSLDACARYDLIIEAIVEKLDVKRELFATLDRLCGPQTVLASNTSSLSISSIA